MPNHVPSQTTIVIADDEAHIRFVLKFKLEKVGYTVITASDGEEALRLVAEHRPAIVLSDYEMPVSTGIEMAQALAADPDLAHTPVIMLTARGFAIEPAELKKTNIKHLLDKPFSPREVLRRITEVLNDPVAA